MQKILPEELGEQLFAFAAEMTVERLEGKEADLSTLGIDKLDRNLHYRELYIINIFSASLAFRGLQRDEMIEERVLQALYQRFLLVLEEQLGFSPEQVEIERDHLNNRMAEYSAIIQENEDYLTPLAETMLNNLRGSPTDNFFHVTSMSIGIVASLKFVPELIDKYEIAG